MVYRKSMSFKCVHKKINRRLTVSSYKFVRILHAVVSGYFSTILSMALDRIFFSLLLLKKDLICFQSPCALLHTTHLLSPFIV